MAVAPPDTAVEVVVRVLSLFIVTDTVPPSAPNNPAISAEVSVGPLDSDARDSNHVAARVLPVAVGVVSVGVVVYGVYLVESVELSLGALIACVILSGRAVAPMAQVAQLTTRYHQSKAALDTLNSMMDLPVERPDVIPTTHSFCRHRRTVKTTYK